MPSSHPHLIPSALTQPEEETASLIGAELDAESESKPKGPAAAYSLSRMRAYMLSRHLRRVQQMKEEDYRRSRARQQGFMGGPLPPGSPQESPPAPRVHTAQRPPTGSVPWTARSEVPREEGEQGRAGTGLGTGGGGGEAEAAIPVQGHAAGGDPGLNPAAVEALMRGGNVDASVLGSLGHALSSLLPHLGGEGGTPASGPASPTATPSQPRAGTGAGGGQGQLTPAALINLGLGLGLGLGVRSTVRGPPAGSVVGQEAPPAQGSATSGKVGDAAGAESVQGDPDSEGEEEVEGAMDTVTRRLDLGGDGDSNRGKGNEGGGGEPSQMPDEARGLALARRVAEEEGSGEGRGDGGGSSGGGRLRAYDTHPPAVRVSPPRKGAPANMHPRLIAHSSPPLALPVASLQSQRSRPGSRSQFDASDASAFAPARPSLPADFLSSLYKPRTGTRARIMGSGCIPANHPPCVAAAVSGETDFTAQTLNVAKAQLVGVTKPGEAIDEWLEEVRGLRCTARRAPAPARE